MDRWCVTACLRSTVTYGILADEIAMDDTDPRKGQIPLVTSTMGTRLRMLRESTLWRQQSQVGETESHSNLHPTTSRPQSVGGTDTDNRNNQPVRPNLPQSRASSVHRQHPSRPRMDTPILPAAPVHAQKRQRDWTQEDYDQVRRPRRQPPSTNPPPSTCQRVNPRPQRLPQVPKRVRGLFEEEELPECAEPLHGVNSYVRAVASTALRNPRISVRASNSMPLRQHPSHTGPMQHAYPASSQRQRSRDPPPYQPRSHQNAIASGSRHHPPSSHPVSIGYVNNHHQPVEWMSESTDDDFMDHHKYSDEVYNNYSDYFNEDEENYDEREEGVDY